MTGLANPFVHRSVDGGYSGQLNVTVGTGKESVPPLVFVDSDLVPGHSLVLSLSEAEELGFALSAAVAEARHLTS